MAKSRFLSYGDYCVAIRHEGAETLSEWHKYRDNAVKAGFLLWYSESQRVRYSHIGEWLVSYPAPHWVKAS